MRTTTHECENTDSCPAGTRHAFPVQGELVTVKDWINVRAVGTGSPTITWAPGELRKVDQVHPQSHEVVVDLGNASAWVCVDDLEMPTYEISACIETDTDILHVPAGEADFWTVYERHPDGTAQALIDVELLEHATAYARHVCGAAVVDIRTGDEIRQDVPVIGEVTCGLLP